MLKDLKAGDFTGLAKEYSKNRPDYSVNVLKSIIGLLSKPLHEIDFVDVGAGTGIWTRMVNDLRPNTTIAVEPNDDMRNSGISDTQGLSINWRKGTAEETGLESGSVDWLSMASSFHWANFEVAIKEFYRVLRPGGAFTAIWNPRLIESNPLFVEIENYLFTLKPEIKRVSSGRSGITEVLTEKLSSSRYFEDVVYIESRHDILMSKSRYIGAWRSVNDLRVQLGPDMFDKFLEFVERKTSDLNEIKTTYLTRSWTAKKVR